MSDDLIRRKDVLDVFEQHWHLIDIMVAIKALPSAQAEPCEDAVSRQYAIEHYPHVCRRTSCKECPLHIQVTNTLTDCELELFLHNLPPAQPERKKGKWIKNDNGTYSCNQCHSWIPEEQHYYAQYCLYCGADMRKGEE